MEFLLIAFAHFLALISPGPDFFLILQTSLRLRLRYAVSVCAGIACANGIYLIIAVLGIEAVRDMTPLMVILKYLGGGYLIFLGVMFLKTPLRSFTPTEQAAPVMVGSIAKQFTMGFMSGILNPKNAIFYLSLFTVMVSESTGLGLRGLYALWMCSLVFFWDMGIAVLLTRRQLKESLGNGVFFIEKVSGVFLTLFGILLAFD